MNVKAHIDPTEIENIKAAVMALQEQINKMGETMDSMSLYLKRLEIRLPIWIDSINEREEDDLHG